MAILYQPLFRVNGSTIWLPYGNPIPDTSVQIIGLSAATLYDFEVTATNPFGSATSTSISASTSTPIGPPPGSVAGSQTTGVTDPVLSGPASGTAVRSTALAITGVIVSDLVSNTPTVWNSADRSPNYSLDASRSAATSGASDAITHGEGIRTTIGKSAGKLFFEVQISGTVSGFLGLGLANSAWVLNAADELGNDLNGIGWYPIGSSTPPQSAYINNVAFTTGSTADVAGATISFAADLTGRLFWAASPAMRAATGAAAWNNSATANPATGVGGISLASLNAGPYLIATSNTDPGAVTTLNTGGIAEGTAFSIAAPNGFTAWDGPSTLTITTTSGTVSATVGGVTVPGSGTTSITYVNSLANIQQALASLVFTAGTVLTTANVKVAVFDRAGATNSLIVPVGVVASVAPSPPTGLVVVDSGLVAPPTPVVVPSAVASLAVLGAPTVNSIQIAWGAPATGSSPFTYSVAFRANSNPTFGTPVTGVTALSYTQTGLQSGTAYNFQVGASNAAGNGPLSSVGPISTAAAVVAPGAVLFLAGSGTPTSSAIQIAWSAPTSGTAPFTYNVAFRLDSNPTFGNPITGVTTTNFTQTGLTSGSAYDFRVTASNTAGTGPAVTAGPISTATVVPTSLTPAHVVLCIMENTSYTTLVGNSQAPYMNSLISQGVLLTNYFAVAHPSEPNYFALFSGSTQGVTDDGDYFFQNATTICGQLFASGRTFIGYPELTGGVEASPRKHNPWESFGDSSAHEVPFSSFPTDFTTLPTYSWVSPNLISDIHDSTIAIGDTWLQNNIKPYVDWCRLNNSVFILTFDEDDSSGNNRVFSVIVGQHISAGSSINTALTHYSMLRMIEDFYGLSRLGSAASAAPIVLPLV